MFPLLSSNKKVKAREKKYIEDINNITALLRAEGRGIHWEGSDISTDQEY